MAATAGPAGDESDWYLAETFARDPFAADPYATEAGPGPYDQESDPAPVDAGTGAAADAGSSAQQAPPPQREHGEPLVEPVVPASRWIRPTAEPEPAGAPSRGGTGVGGSGTHSGHSGHSAVAEAPERPFVPVIEFDPPLSAEEVGLRAAAVGEPALAATTEPTAEPAAEPPAAPEPEATPPGRPSETGTPVTEPGAPDRPGTPGDPTESADPAEPTDPTEVADPAEPAVSRGKVTGLVNSSAIMAAGTLVSRATGFLRTMVIAAAIGVGTMGDSYSAANTLPTLLYILIGGGALNAVFVPQLVRSMKQDEDGGTAYANRLLTLVMTGLAGVVFVAVLAAPLLVQLISHSLMSTPTSADTTVALARYCLPTIFFMGVHVVMGQILNARGRFGAMMWTPVLNNVVVIFTFSMYLWVFGTFQHSRVTPESVSPEGLRLLGIGTLLGLAVQALAMIPYLRAADFHFRPRFDWRGHGLGKAARLAKWTFLFVLANQAGYLVVTQLATAAGGKAATAGYLGVGLAAYSNALLIWQLPMAVITVSVMSAVLPRLSRAAADGDAAAVRDDLSYGLRTSAVAIVPAAFLFLALGPQIGGAIYGLGNGGSAAHGTTAVGFMLSAFALGLIPYSVQYVLLRGFYAYEDTRTPFSNTVWVAAAQAAAALLCFLLLPAQWAVTGMALGYGASYLVGVGVALPKLKQRIGGLDTGRIAKTYARLAIACVPAALVGFLVATVLGGLLGGWLGSVLAVLFGGAGQLAVFLTLARRMRIEELNAMIGMVRTRLGR
ncbi:murein biosynthesis integral membrane protein MurJ [Kitasatospora sp. NBC_01266]|uniref:murein biosynthesis integral membrane protein MurJ n=1 Tax=Kitasatospora sp. NBC_01266 TaxID=2903572 RepID=UPI002E372C06|nr:murein biosynthesis integral membrane protein MurJ [Kitasatospora sp. NBC_01266]